MATGTAVAATTGAATTGPAGRLVARPWAAKA